MTRPTGKLDFNEWCRSFLGIELTPCQEAIFEALQDGKQMAVVRMSTTRPKFRVGQEVRWCKPGHAEDGMTGTIARVALYDGPRSLDDWMYFPEDPGWQWTQGWGPVMGYAPERHLVLDREEAVRIVEEDIKRSTEATCGDLFEDLVELRSRSASESVRRSRISGLKRARLGGGLLPGGRVGD